MIIYPSKHTSDTRSFPFFPFFYNYYSYTINFPLFSICFYSKLPYCGQPCPLLFLRYHTPFVVVQVILGWLGLVLATLVIIARAGTPSQAKYDDENRPCVVNVYLLCVYVAFVCAPKHSQQSLTGLFFGAFFVVFYAQLPKQSDHVHVGLLNAHLVGIYFEQHFRFLENHLHKQHNSRHVETFSMWGTGAAVVPWRYVCCWLLEYVPTLLFFFYVFC